jgi:hypothetical protein
VELFPPYFTHDITLLMKIEQNDNFPRIYRIVCWIVSGL